MEQQNELEQAAIKYDADNFSYPTPGSNVLIPELTARQWNINAFTAGAEWQRKQTNWISVKDRLPEKSGRYLIYFPERSTSPMDAIWNVHEKTWGRDFDRTEYVTHWMPIPEPPQDGGKTPNSH